MRLRPVTKGCFLAVKAWHEQQSCQPTMTYGGSDFESRTDSTVILTLVCIQYISTRKENAGYNMHII